MPGLRIAGLFVGKYLMSCDASSLQANCDLVQKNLITFPPGR
jgi:hypothetical protein